MTDRALLRALLVLLVIVGLAWVAAGVLGDDAHLANAEANDRFAAGEGRQALSRYRALQLARPDLREVDVNAATAALRVGETARALLDFIAGSRASDPRVRATAFYDRGNALFAAGRLADARASWVDSLRADPSGFDAKFNIEVVDGFIEQLGPEGGQPDPAQQGAGQGRGPGQAPGQPGASPSPGPGQQGAGNQGQGVAPDRNPNASPPPSVGQAIIRFRRNLSIDDAMNVLDALEAEQHGIQGLLEGQVPRRGNQGTPLY